MTRAKDPTALAEPLGSLVRFALALAAKEGRYLSLVSGLRTRDEQIALRRQNCGTSEYLIYEAPSSACSPYTARPGTSRHETGNAADMDGAKEWMAALLAPYNVDRRVPGEDWHFQWYGTDVAGTLQQLDADMKRRGFTDAERATVRTGSGTITGGSGTASGSTRGGVSGSGSAGGGVTLGLPSVSNPLDSLTDVAALVTRPFTDAALQRRILIGAAGVALVVAGGSLLARDLALDLTIPKGMTR